MYSNILDTTRAINEEACIEIEAFLMRTALLGKPAVLSPNQAMDSTAIQLIMKDNNDVYNSTNYFIKAIENGIVKIAIPEKYGSIIDYCLETIKQSTEDSCKEIYLSSLKFLNEKENNIPRYTREQRVAVLNYIGECFQKGKNDCKKNPALQDDKDKVDEYIWTIEKLNNAIRKYESFVDKKYLIPRFIKNAINKYNKCAYVKKSTKDCLEKVWQQSKIDYWPTYRSYYYRLLSDNFTNDFDNDVITEVKSIIDICYNDVMGLSIGGDRELNIPLQFTNLAHIHASRDNADLEIATSNSVDYDEVLDWERLVEVHTSISEMCKTDKIIWKDALDRFYRQERRLPFKLGAEYLITTLVVRSISGGLAESAGGVVEFVWGEFASMFLGIPNFLEVLKKSQQARRNVKMLNFLVRKKGRLK